MNEYQLLYRAYGILDAKSIQLLLESFEIKSEIIQESTGVTYGLTLGNLGSANIYVQKSQFEDAEKIIALLEAGDLELPNSDLDPNQNFEETDDSDFEDLEDAVQYFAAKEQNMDIIITRNKKDFILSKIKVLTPAEFLKQNL